MVDDKKNEILNGLIRARKACVSIKKMVWPPFTNQTKYQLTTINLSILLTASQRQLILNLCIYGPTSINLTVLF